MGWETAKFVDGQDLDGFNCSICLSVLCDPFSLGCVNEHLFCKTCLEGYMRSTCPVCRAEVRPNQRRPSPFVKRMIDRLRVRCGVDTTEVCAWEGSLGDGHDQVCERRQVSCPTTARQVMCPWKGPWSDLEEHTHFQCPLALLTCTRGNACHEQYYRMHTQAHDGVCEGFECYFRTEDGCAFSGRRMDRDLHQGYCGCLHDDIKQLKTRLEESEGQRRALEARLATPPSPSPAMSQPEASTSEATTSTPGSNEKSKKKASNPAPLAQQAPQSQNEQVPSPPDDAWPTPSEDGDTGQLLVAGNPRIPFQVSQKVFDVFAEYVGTVAIPSAVPWSEFLYAMTAIGFESRQSAGASSWKFSPTGAIADNIGISIHGPQPEIFQRSNQVAWTGKRLRRTYGLHIGMFAVV